MKKRIVSFSESLASHLDCWLNRSPSPHTRRAYREDMAAFARHLRIGWPDDSRKLLNASVEDVQAFRDAMVACGAAPMTIHRRLGSVAGFYNYLAAVAGELRLPVSIPNPAQTQFVSRGSSAPRRETKALTAAEARELLAMPAGDSPVSCRDRAILTPYLYTGMRLATGCRLEVGDFHPGREGATIRLTEKGGKHRSIGIHRRAARAIEAYIRKAGLKSGPLFRPQLNSRTTDLSIRAIDEVTMHRVIVRYLARLPGSTIEELRSDGSTVRRCVFTPHSLRATAATLLLDAGVDIGKVQELLGHCHVTTTLIYDKRRRTAAQSASHFLVI